MASAGVCFSYPLCVFGLHPIGHFSDGGGFFGGSVVDVIYIIISPMVLFCRAHGQILAVFWTMAFGLPRVG